MEVKKGIPYKTELNNDHKKLNAKMIDFHGWEMPLEYSGIIYEHMAVRKHVGIFDVSHMGDIIISGNDADKFVDYMFPSKVSALNINECLYTSFLDNKANMIDDTIIYKLNKKKFFLIPNASTIDKIYNWLLENKNNYDVDINNYSNNISHIAVQGPDAFNVLNDMDIEIPENFRVVYHKINYKNVLTGNNNIMVSGTGYTGENGVELIISNDIASEIWNELLSKIKKYNGLPCGLGARDTLRIEKGMLLSGQDFNEDKNPYEASISFIINYDHNFIGKDKLLKAKENYDNIFRGFILENRNIPRNGFEIYSSNNDLIGKITSGSLSPILNCGIGLGYINKKYNKINDIIYIKIRNNLVKGKISRPKILK